jgi:hypothetical protein
MHSTYVTPVAFAQSFKVRYRPIDNGNIQELARDSGPQRSTTKNVLNVGQNTFAVSYF